MYTTLFSQNLECGFMRDCLEQFECENLLQLDKFKQEIDYVRNSILTQEDHVIVFSHGDLNHSNILVMEDESEEEEEGESRFDLKFVDFDFSRYFYRGECE